MRSKGSRFTLGVWGLRVCSLDVAFTFNRPQPFATVRPYGRAYGKFCRRGHFWRFQTSRFFVSHGRRGTSWRSDVSCKRSKIVLCGRRDTFATFPKDSLQFSWQAQHFGRVHRHFSWQAQRFRRVVRRVFPHIFVWGSCFWLCTSAPPPTPSVPSVPSVPPAPPAPHTITHTLCPHFAWQAWQLWHWTGSGGVLGSQWTSQSPRLLAWQAWRLVTPSFTLRGRRDTYGAGLALVARLGPSGRRGRRGCWRGRRGTWWHRASLCRRDTWRHRPPPCVAAQLLWHWIGSGAVGVAGMALGDIELHFAWQAWHLWHWTSSGGTQNSSTQLCHRCLSHTTLSHTTLSHTSLSHTIFHTQLCHTHTHISFTHNSFTHSFVTYISLTHNLLRTTLSHTTLSHTTLLRTQTYTHTQNTVTHSSFTPPVLHHLLSFLPFPSHFHICLWSLEEVDLWGYAVL